GFEKKCREHFVGEQRAGDAAGEIREAAPVGAELIRHHQARDHAHTEIDGENLYPEMIEIAVHLGFGFEPESLEHGEVAGEADGDGGRNDVKGNGEGDLNSGKFGSIQSQHDDASATDDVRVESTARLWLATIAAELRWL